VNLGFILSDFFSTCTHIGLIIGLILALMVYLVVYLGFGGWGGGDGELIAHFET
jgi:hypothetical protein